MPKLLTNMVKRKYSHIFFDLDNTLWDFEKNSYNALHVAFLHFSIDKQEFDYEYFFAIYSKYNSELWKEYRQQKVIKNELKRLRFQLTFDDLNISGIDADEMNAFYLSEMPKQTNLIDGTEEILQYLKKKGYALYIITNGFQEVQFKKLQITNLSNYFTKIFLSEAIKAHKPDRKIFEYSVKSANAPKKSSLMIGDDWKSDIEGAINFGIDSVFFNPYDLDCKNTPIKYSKKNMNIYSIKNLSELRNIL